ncbi:hypothetical protein L2K70_04705 [Nocardioides KLBMP 9356]|uniref:Phage tail protein n=1 Tax=Nocardioides potassii TaxID=2911371 RepID=A0ABS9H9K6_9ACTN|nr:hypothetical protein [Nocardioides potassii]MCF6376895.1 hypothetical protein [Nocardioides potassii]
MADLVQFVDSISSSPTVRLDLNDEISFWVKSFSAPPPRLRRSMASNAMRDGISVGSSNYDGRTLTMEIECRKPNQDAAAVEMQKLWRELDRPTNLIRYHPQGASKPVFFRTFRSDASQLADVVAQAAMRTFTIEVLAEPFALGLRETLGPYTVNNDPAAASGALKFTIPMANALGDVPAPFLASATTGSTAKGVWFATGTPTIAQAEACSLGIDTTNPGGGPDAAMSGTGTNNYVTTSFSTNAAMVQRLQTPTTLFGLYRVAAVVRRSDATSVFTARAAVPSFGVVGDTVTIPLTTNRQVVDLGIIRVGSATEILDYSYTATGASTNGAVQAARTSGSGSLQWDALLFLPVDSQFLVAEFGTARMVSIDSATQSVVGAVGNLLTGSAVSEKAAVAGGFPVIQPAVDNTFTWVHQAARLESHTKAAAISVTVYYHPQYLFVRPVSS